MNNIIILMMSLALSVTPIKPFSQTQTQYKPVKPIVASASPIQGKIAGYIYSVVPNKGKDYAHKLSKMIYEASMKNNIDPLWVTAVAKVESDFCMSAQSQVGIMQFTRATGREMKKLYGYNIYDTHDNIWAGATYLASSLPQRKTIPGNLSSRGGYDRGIHIRHMYIASAVYNDGPYGYKTKKGQRYAEKVLRTKEIIVAFNK